MPGRDIKLINGGIYHLFNKTIDSKLVFNNDYLSSLFLNLISYYCSSYMKISYSHFIKLEKEKQKLIWENIKQTKYRYIEILAYCFMPNHFHLLVKQRLYNGVSISLSNILNSFTRTYNLLSERKGELFLSPFKSVEVRTREQLIHVSRYIHLNPYSAGLVVNTDDLILYRWSSLKYYARNIGSDLLNKKIILDEFTQTPQKYEKFVLDNAGYQKSLERLKHVEKWK